MQLIKMTEYRARETVALLTTLLERAKHGDVHGLTLGLLNGSGVEEIAITDVYRRDPSKAANAAMRMCWRLTQHQDELDAARTPLALPPT